VLWTGSGLGAQAGLPTWSAFLAECRASLGEIEGRPERIAAKPDLPDYLRRRFSVATELPEAHRLIKQLEFPTLISTSMDNLLERAFPHLGGRVYTARDCDGLLQAIRRREVFLLKPFGDLDAPETICFGPAQCNEAMQQNPATSELLESLLQSRVFLFLGASLEGLEQDLARIAILEPAGRRHFALVPDTGEGWKPLAESLKQRYRIEAMPYTPSSAEHPEVAEFLTALIAAIREKTSQAYIVASEGK
jgi:hypothetical protein